MALGGLDKRRIVCARVRVAHGWGWGRPWPHCPLFALSSGVFLYSWESGSAFPSGEEGRQKREIKNCHGFLVNTVYGAERGLSRRQGLRERQGQGKVGLRDTGRKGEQVGRSHYLRAWVGVGCQGWGGRKGVDRSRIGMV